MNVIGCALRIAKFGVRPNREERVKEKKNKKGNARIFLPRISRRKRIFPDGADLDSIQSFQIVEREARPRANKLNRERERKKTRKNEKENGSSDNSNGNGVEEDRRRRRS